VLLNISRSSAELSCPVSSPTQCVTMSDSGIPSDTVDVVAWVSPRDRGNCTPPHPDASRPHAGYDISPTALIGGVVDTDIRVTPNTSSTLAVCFAREARAYRQAAVMPRHPIARRLVRQMRTIWTFCFMGGPAPSIIVRAGDGLGLAAIIAGERTGDGVGELGVRERMVSGGVGGSGDGSEGGGCDGIGDDAGPLGGVAGDIGGRGGGGGAVGEGGDAGCGNTG